MHYILDDPNSFYTIVSIRKDHRRAVGFGCQTDNYDDDSSIVRSKVAPHERGLCKSDSGTKLFKQWPKNWNYSALAN